MANTIKHKRGTTAPTAGQLVVGELAINTATGEVYTKTDGGSVIAMVNSASPTFTGVPAAPLAAEGTDTTQLATTSFVQQELAAGAGMAKGVVASVRNETGATLTKGTVVYISGASGNKALVSKAQANSESTSSGAYGLVQANIANNNNGTVVIAGIITGLNTSAYTDGDKIYLSPTVAGEWTTTKPAAPNHMVFLGTVTRNHATQGTIQLRISNGFELEELHNVSIPSTPTDGYVLTYNSSTSLWGAEAPSGGGGGTWGSITGTLSSQTDLQTALDLKADLESPTFTTRIYTPAIRNLLNTDLQIDAYNDAGSGTHFLHYFNASDGRLLLATNGGGLTFPDATTQVTAGIADAPSDGDEYVRKDGAWSVATGGGGSYLPLAGGTMTGAITFDGTSGQYISKGNFDTSRGGNYGISLVCSIGYEFNWQAGWLTTTEQSSVTPRPLYLDSLAGTTLRVWNSSTSAGTEVTHTGITFPDSTSQTTAGIADAPSDGDEYVRKDGAWAVATGGGGGGLTISDLSNAATSTLNATAPTSGQALTYDGTDLVWATVSGSYLPLAGGTMTGAINFGTGGQNIDVGTFDSGRYGSNGISLKCAVGFELNWQAGWLTGNQFLGTPSITPIYIDSGAGSTLKVWEGTTSTGVTISHTGITFPDSTTLTTAPLADAPSDGSNYGRKDGAWVATLPDAPSDSTQYVRYNGAWAVNSGFTHGDSPNDGNMYARAGSGVGWVQIGTGTDAIATENYVDTAIADFATTTDVSTAVSGLVTAEAARKKGVVDSVRAVVNEYAISVDGSGYVNVPLVTGALNAPVSGGEFSSGGKWFGFIDPVGGVTITSIQSISLSSGVVTMIFPYGNLLATSHLYYTEDGGTTWVASTFRIA